MVAMIVFFPFQSDYPNMDRKILITSQQRPNYDKQHHQFQLIIQMRYMSIYVWWSYQPYFCGVIPCSRLTNERKRSGSCQNNDDPLFPIGIGLQEGDRLPGTFSSPFQTRGLPLVVRNCMLSDYTQRQDQFLQINVRHQSSPLLKGFSLLDCCPLRLGQVFSLSERLFLNCLHFFFFSQAMTSSISLECSGLSPILPKLRPVFNINFMIVRAFRAAQKTRLGSLWAGKGVSLPSPSSTRQPLSLQFGSNGMTAFYSVSSPPPSDEGKPPQNSPVPSAQEKVASPPISVWQPLTESFNPPAKQQGSASTQSQGENNSASISAVPKTPHLKSYIPLGEHDYGAIQDMLGYVDKTFFTYQILSRKHKAILFTMPRRFGKSAVLSMIQYCFFYLTQLKMKLERQKMKLVQRFAFLEGETKRLKSKLEQEQYVNIQKIKDQYQKRNHQAFKQNTRRMLSEIYNELADINKRLENLNKTSKDSNPLSLKELFEGKVIYQNQEFQKGTYRFPIIKLQLKSYPNLDENPASGEKTKSVSQLETNVINNFKRSVSRTFRQHSYLMQSLHAKIEMPSTAPISKEILSENLTKFCRIHDYQTDPELPFTDDEFKGSIVFLSELLEDHWSEYWGKEAKPLILVDQYDLPFIDNMGKPFQMHVFQLLNEFYSSFIKGPGADHNFKVVMMGILPIKYSDIFSRANNLWHFNLCSNMEPFFGFTTEEVKEKLRLVLQNRKEPFCEKMFDTQFDKIEDWCNGYWISNREMYNPWSVNSCLYQIKTADKLPIERFKSAWTKTGDTSIIKNMIKNSRSQVAQKINKFIIDGYQYEESKQERFAQYMPLHKVQSPAYLFFLLFHAGYLTKDRYRQNVYVVPNREIMKRFFCDIFVSMMEKKYPGISQYAEEIESRVEELLDKIDDIEIFKNHLEKLLNYLMRIKYPILSVWDQKQTSDQQIKVYTKDIQEMVKSKLIQYLFHSKQYPGYKVLFQNLTGENKKMDRFIYSELKDTAIIHQDKFARSQSGIDQKICEALNQILEKYLESALDEALKKNPNTKNIQIAAFVISKIKHKKKKGKKTITPDIQKETDSDKKYVKLATKGFTFTIENARELLKEYREKFGGLKKGDICKKGNKEKREEFLEMLARYQKMVEKKIDQ